jgi:hypothetical protein
MKTYHVEHSLGFIVGGLGMANAEQLELIRSGPAAWNAWRQNHMEVNLDFSGADLSNTDLSRIELLHNADLSAVDFSNANLAGAFHSLEGKACRYVRRFLRAPSSTDGHPPFRGGKQSRAACQTETVEF